MEAIRFSNVSALLILLLLSLSLRATSKDQTVSCTMCTSCDNPCNPVPSSSPPPTPPSGGGSYYYSPPPPTPPSSGGGGSYYYPPPSTSGGGKYPPPYGDGGQSYYYPPASYGNYPTPPPPNPIVPYFPFYYHIPPPGDSGSDRKTHKTKPQDYKDKAQKHMGEPNRKSFLGRKPIILNPKAPLHSLKVRERDACQDPHCEGPRITRPPRVDRTTIREARVERSKPHLFTGMQTTVATILGNPTEVDNRFRQDQRESATKSPPWSPNPLKLLISKNSIYTLRNIKRLRSNQKSTRIFRTRVDWTKEKQKHRSRTGSGSNWRRSRRKDYTIRTTAFPETIAGEIRCC
ncbi:hypothetical protein Bca4012_074900 [Brassica carinata]